MALLACITLLHQCTDSVDLLPSSRIVAAGTTGWPLAQQKWKQMFTAVVATLGSDADESKYAHPARVCVLVCVCVRVRACACACSCVCAGVRVRRRASRAYVLPVVCQHGVLHVHRFAVNGLVSCTARMLA